MATLLNMQSYSDNRYHYAGTVTDTTSQPLYLINNRRNALVMVVPGTSATVQYTLSDVTKVVNDNAVWHDWPNGSVVEQSSDSVSGLVTALRLVSVGASSWEVSK